MIRLVNVNKRYGELQAVDNISLEIPSHTIFGIIGKSGAGKSTLVRLISLLEPVDSGEIYYGDSRVDTLTGKLLRNQHKKIGMIFQNFNLFASRTAAGNIAYPLEIAGMPKRAIAAKVEEMLNVVGLEGRGNARVSTLSGGQKQRVAIARALVNQPAIVLADEPTGALDTKTGEQIMDLLTKLNQEGKTIIMVTHEPEIAAFAHRRIVIRDGVISSDSKLERGT